MLSDDLAELELSDIEPLMLSAEGAEDAPISSAAGGGRQDVDAASGSSGSSSSSDMQQQHQHQHAASHASPPGSASASSPRHRHPQQRQHRQHEQQQHSSASSSPRSAHHRPHSSSSSHSASSRLSRALTASSSSSSSLSCALPLLLSSSTASALIKTAGVTELSRADRRWKAGMGGLGGGKESKTATGSAAAASAPVQPSARSAAAGEGEEEREPAVHRPYFLSESDRGSTVALSPAAVRHLSSLLRSLCDAQDGDERYDFHFLLRRQAVQLAAERMQDARLSGSADSQRVTLPAQHPPSAASESGAASLSSLLLSFLSSSCVSAPFLSSFSSLLSSQSPFGLRSLPKTELRYLDNIAALLAMQAKQETAAPLLRYWLGVGSLLHSLQAVNFLLQLQSASPSPPQLPSSMRGFLQDWAAALSDINAPILRIARSKHLTAVASSARRVSLSASALSPSASSASAASLSRARRPHCGRKWDCEDDSGWERYDDRTSAVLEAAYQAGKATVDFTVEGKPHTYRADFSRMVQRNLQTGREKPLRSLLALLIREKSGRVTQTVEINMPHATSIRELRRELAQYLKHDERQLRMMYANRVLRRVDYSHVTIRDGIVPLGAEPLIVTKIAQGDVEELCSFVLTGTERVRQEAWECLSCDFVHGRHLCSICAQVCHRGHTVRLLSNSLPCFCHCGAGAGGFDAPCHALEESPDDREPPQPASLCCSSCGDFVYVLTPELGLLKVGSGGGQTVTGRLYAQNSLMSIHAGGVMVEANGRLLLRSPMMRPELLLVVDRDSLLLTDERIILDSQQAAPPDSEQQQDAAEEAARRFVLRGSSGDSASLFSSSFTLEYSGARLDAEESDDALKSDSAASAQPAEDGGSSGGRGGSSSGGWLPLEPFFLHRIKQAFLLNPQYGDLIPSVAPPAASSTSLPELMASTCACLSIEEEGLYLRIPGKLGMKRCRVRVRHREHVQPLFIRPGEQGGAQQLLVVNLDDLSRRRTAKGEGAGQSGRGGGDGGAGGDASSGLLEEKQEDREEERKEEALVRQVGTRGLRRRQQPASIIVDSRAEHRERSQREREREEKEREREREKREEQQRTSGQQPSSSVTAKSRRRHHAMMVDVFSLPEPSPSSAPVHLPFCSQCGHLLLSSPSSCSVCQAAAESDAATAVGSDPDLLIVLDEAAQRQLEELKEADRRSRLQEDERRHRTEQATPQQQQSTGKQLQHKSTQPAGSSSSPSSSDAGTESDAALEPSSAPPAPVNRSYATVLQSLGFSALRVEKALLWTANASLDAALQWLISNADKPDIDAPWFKVKWDASLAAAAAASALQPDQLQQSDKQPALFPSSSVPVSSSPPTSSPSASRQQLSFLRCSPHGSFVLDCVVDTYRPITPRPARLEPSLPSSPVSAAAPSSSSPCCCDGCGSTSRPLHLCLHRDCRELHLCDFCQLQGLWTQRAHQHWHTLEKHSAAAADGQQQSPDEEMHAEEDGPQAEAGEAGSRLTLGEYTAYCDTRRHQLVLLRQREPGRKDSSALVFDLSAADDRLSSPPQLARCVGRGRLGQDERRLLRLRVYQRLRLGICCHLRQTGEMEHAAACAAVRLALTVSILLLSSVACGRRGCSAAPSPLSVQLRIPHILLAAAELPCPAAHLRLPRPAPPPPCTRRPTTAALLLPAPVAAETDRAERPDRGRSRGGRAAHGGRTHAAAQRQDVH